MTKPCGGDARDGCTDHDRRADSSGADCVVRQEDTDYGEEKRGSTPEAFGCGCSLKFTDETQNFSQMSGGIRGDLPAR